MFSCAIKLFLNPTKSLSLLLITKMLKIILTFCFIAAVCLGAPVEEEVEGDGDEPIDFGTIRIRKTDMEHITVGGAFYVMRNVGNEISVR